MAPVKIKRNILIVTKQSVTDEPADVEGFFIREWSVEIFLLTEAGDPIPANVYKKAVYNLHPSFGKRQFQTFTEPPFKLSEKGWGEFVMTITLHTKNDETHQISHDLNFQSERYEVNHTVEFKKVQGELGELLRESGAPADDHRGKKDDARRKSTKPDGKKKDTRKATVDMNQLAHMLPRLPEEVLLTVVQIIQDNMTPDVYVKNDPEKGEFHVDLYTLPDNTAKKLWDVSVSHLEE